MAVVMNALRRLVTNPKTANFARSLDYSDLPKNWADDPEIVKLAEDVYAELGTKSPFFKAWFGDWEAKRATDYAMNGKPVTHLSGNEFQKDGVKITDKVPAWYEQNYRGEVENPELGKVLLNLDGVKDSLGHGLTREKASGFAAVPEIIKEGKIFDRQPNWKGRGWDSSVMAAPVDYAGTPSIGEVVTRTNKDGTNQFYLHRLEDKNKLASVFKTPSTLQQQHGAPAPASKLILGQKADNVKLASRVVDEEGNPLKLYHGTAENITSFDPSKGRANMDIQGSFFSPMKEEAQDYGPTLYEVYLNLQNPADLRTGFKAFKAHQGETGAGIKARDDLRAAGFDGVNNDGEEYIAFIPEQIKAVTNRGTFNPQDPNMYRGLLALAGGGAAASALSPGEANAAEIPVDIPSEGLLGRAALEGQPQAQMQNEGTGGGIWRGLSSGTRAVLEGLGGLAEMGPNAIVNLAISPFTDYRFRNPGTAAADAMGLATPQTDAEKSVYGLVQGATEAVPFVGGGAALAKGAGGTARQFGKWLADSPKTQAVLGGLLGLMAGSGE